METTGNLRLWSFQNGMFNVTEIGKNEIIRPDKLLFAHGHVVFWVALGLKVEPKYIKGIARE